MKTTRAAENDDVKDKVVKTTIMRRKRLWKQRLDYGDDGGSRSNDDCDDNVSKTKDIDDNHSRSQEGDDGNSRRKVGDNGVSKSKEDNDDYVVPPV